MAIQKGYERRKERTRTQINRCNHTGRARLSVYRANKNIYAEIIDLNGKVIVACSSVDKELKPTLTNQDGKHTKTGMEIATEVGTKLATRAKQMGTTCVVFDTSGYLYSGRIKALAEAARKAGLEF